MVQNYKDPHYIHIFSVFLLFSLSLSLSPDIRNVSPSHSVAMVHANERGIQKKLLGAKNFVSSKYFDVNSTANVAISGTKGCRIS
jgi:hypothetical protein